MYRVNVRTRRAWLIALFAVIAFADCNTVQAETLAGPSLVQHLRQGGYVLLMRHAHSPPTLPDRSSADSGNTHLERQLDETGRDTARAMGKAIRQLAIPVGAVLSSPTFRALETVRLAALGTPRTYAQLGDGGQSMMAGAVRDQTSWLREKVGKRPNAGLNTIIVTHMPNIQVAFGQDATNLTDGEALIFHPNGHGGADLVAHIKIEDWLALAGN